MIDRIVSDKVFPGPLRFVYVVLLTNPLASHPLMDLAIMSSEVYSSTTGYLYGKKMLKTLF